MRVGFDCWLGNAHKSPPSSDLRPEDRGWPEGPRHFTAGPNVLSASADSSLYSFPSEVEDNIEECDMRAYAFGLATACFRWDGIRSRHGGGCSPARLHYFNLS